MRSDSICIVQYFVNSHRVHTTKLGESTEVKECIDMERE